MTHDVKTTLNDEVLTVSEQELNDLERLGILVEVDGEPVGTEEEPTGDEKPKTEDGGDVPLVPGDGDTPPKTEGTDGEPPLGDAPGVPTIAGTGTRSGRKGKE